MAKLKTRHEKHVYVVGDINLTSTSTPYAPLQKMYFKSAKVTLGNAPAGSGNTVVRIIRNNDTNDILYTATIGAGVSSVNLNTEATLNAGDKMSLNVSSLASGSGGSDLIFKLEYHN